MNRLVLQRLVLSHRFGSPEHPPLDVELEPGCHGLLHRGSSSLGEAISILSGEVRPRRGRVLLAGKALFTSPKTRAQLGVLAPAGSFESLGTTAREHLVRARHLRKLAGVESHEEAQLFEEKELDRPISELSTLERRLLQAEVAFAIKKPLALLLENPLWGLSTIQTDWLLSRLSKAQSEEVVVLVVGNSLEQIHPLSEEVLGQTPRAGQRALTLQLRVERPREIAARAQALDCVRQTRLDPRRPDLLEVTGTDGPELPAALSRIVVACDCALFEMTALEGPGRRRPSADSPDTLPQQGGAE